MIGGRAAPKGFFLGADIVQVGADDMDRVRWADLELVDHWRRYLADPQAYLRHIVG